MEKALIQLYVPREYRDHLKDLASVMGMSIQSYIKYLIAMEEERKRK